MATRAQDPTTAGAGFELLLFATDPALVVRAEAAGMDGFIVDWERRGKYRRQAGQGTQINRDTLADLLRVRAATSSRVICRVNGFGSWTAREVESAVAAGADELLLPMVRTTREVDLTLDLVAGRCGLGILVETCAGVAAAAALASRPLTRVYVGLNDLRIDRGSSQLFEPLVDGTVDKVRSEVWTPRFGVAGLTLPDRGTPVPSRLLAGELLRLRADFTFLRRSFLADTGGRNLRSAVEAIRADLDAQSMRDPVEVEADHGRLRAALARDLVRSA